VSAELIIRPGHTVASRDAFIEPESYPPFSVALDGYVNAPPFIVPSWEGGPYANFDHHTGVERLATLSTSQQVLRAIRQGFVGAFSEAGDYKPTAYVNDCDQDVALSWYLLSHGPDIAAQKTLKRGSPIRRLVDVAGDLDVTAGAYPYPARMKIVKELSWIFRPFTEARAGGLTRDAEEQRYIIGQCCGRIGLHLVGQGSEVELDTRYEILGGGTTWKLFQEVGAEGRIGAFRDGIDAYVIYKGQRPSGAIDCALGRISEFTNFNVKGAVRDLNEAEGLTDPANRWGCDDAGIVGGSPRLTGSMLSLGTIAAIIKEVR